MNNHFTQAKASTYKGNDVFIKTEANGNDKWRYKFAHVDSHLTKFDKASAFRYSTPKKAIEAGEKLCKPKVWRP